MVKGWPDLLCALTTGEATVQRKYTIPLRRTVDEHKQVTRVEDALDHQHGVVPKRERDTRQIYK